LVVLLTGAVAVGVFFTATTRRSFLKVDEVDATPELLLARVKQDPTRLSPIAVVSRLGAEATLELLEYGDQIRTTDWRYKWSSVREELLRLLSQQNAFGPAYALARYYRSTDAQEPDTIRIRRTALIHKLGTLRCVRGQWQRLLRAPRQQRALDFRRASGGQAAVGPEYLVQRVPPR
jgi:hypothetical protein